MFEPGICHGGAVQVEVLQVFEALQLFEARIGDLGSFEMQPNQSLRVLEMD